MSEKIFPTNDETLKKAVEAFDAAKAKLVERGASYGALLVDEYFPFGVKSYAQMVHLKAARIVSEAHQGRVTQGSMEDSCEDLLNYTAFLWAYIQIEKENRSKAPMPAWPEEKKNV